jgi:AraC-like DNA-binding protein
MINIELILFAGFRFPQEDVYKMGLKIINSRPEKKKRPGKNVKTKKIPQAVVLCGTIRNLMARINPILLRHILTFFLFALAVLLLFVPVYRYVSRFTLENELSYVRNRLRGGISVFDTTIMALNNTLVFTSGDSRFRILKYRPLHIGENPFLLTELQRTFNGIILSHSLIADAGIIFSREVILTRQRMFLFPDLYSFYDEYIRCGDLSMAGWTGLLSSGKPIIPVRPYSSRDFGSYEALTFAVRWYFADEPGQNIMYATLPVKNIVPLIADGEVAARSYIRIYDTGGNILMDYSGGSKDREKEKLHVLREESAAAPVSFEIGIPESVIKGKMRPVKNMMLIFALIAAGIIIILSLLFAYKGSEPMRGLLASIDATKNVKSEYEQYTKNGSLNFLKGFRRVYTDLAKSISVVDARLENSLRTIEQQTHLVRERIFDKALRRGIYGDGDQREFQSVFPDFPGLFQLAVVQYDYPGVPAVQETAAVQLRLINTIKSRLDRIFIQGLDGNAVVLLLPVSSGEDNWFPRFQSLRSELNRQINLPLSFSLSDVFDKASDLPRAWRQLQFIHVTPGIDDLVSVGQMKDDPPGRAQLPLNIYTPQMIYLALCNGNDAAACAILEECMPLLSETGGLVSGLVFNMLHDVIMLLKLENPSILLNINAPRYEGSRREDLFKKDFPGCFRQIAEKIRSNREDRITAFGRKILDYINEYLYDPELYSTVVLDHFDISQPTLQKLMKIVTGQTFLVYVETQRLTRAYEMLQTGKGTIQEVAAQCGFSKSDSFYKAFKRTYGFPPSDILNRRGP